MSTVTFIKKLQCSELQVSWSLSASPDAPPHPLLPADAHYLQEADLYYDVCWLNSSRLGFQFQLYSLLGVLVTSPLGLSAVSRIRYYRNDAETYFMYMLRELHGLYVPLRTLLGTE